MCGLLEITVNTIGWIQEGHDPKPQSILTSFYLQKDKNAWESDLTEHTWPCIASSSL